MERLRRGQVVNFWLVNVWSSKCTLYILLHIHHGCFNLRYLRNSDKAWNSTIPQESTACKGWASPRLIWKSVWSWSVDHKLWNCLGRLITLLQEASFLGDSWETPPKSIQWSFRRRKRSTKLSFTQFAADSVQQPCQASTTGCRGVGRADIRTRPSFKCIYSSPRDQVLALKICV